MRQSNERSGYMKSKKSVISIFVIATVVLIVATCSVDKINFDNFMEKENIYENIESLIPTNSSDLDGTLTYTISTADDWLALQSLSKTTSLDGYTFTVANDLDNGTDTWNLSAISGFTGIGSEEYPFMGSLVCGFDTGRAITTNCPLFACLSAKATLSKIEIISSNAKCGIAKLLVGAGTPSFTNVRVSSGNIVNTTSNDAAGAFGEIKNTDSDNPMVLNINSSTLYVSASSVKGDYAGYIAGKVTGNVEINIDSSCIGNSVTKVTVIGSSLSGSIGGYFGYVDGTADGSINKTVEITLSGSLSKLLSVTGSGNAGGIIGSCKNTNISSADTASFGINSVSNDDRGDISTSSNGSNAGGFVGKSEDSSFENVTVYNCRIQSTSSSSSYKGFSGGFVGYFIANTSNTNTSYINNIVSNMCYASSSSAYAGGVIGDAINLSDTKVVLSNLINSYKGIEDYFLYGKSAIGGIAGGLEGNNFKLENITVNKNENSGTGKAKVSCLNLYGCKIRAVGGAVGIISSDCEIVGAVIDNNTTKDGTDSSSSVYIGGVVGYIANNDKNQHKIYLNEITATGDIYNSDSNTMITISEGGVIGFVADNIVVEFDGNNDISGIKYPAREGDYIGQVIGMRGNSLIYIQSGATINKPDNSAYICNVDEIGNFGGIIRNAKYDGESESLLIVNDEITGSVIKSDGYYQIDTVGDMIRVAIAINLEGTFGLESFAGITNYKDLLADNYLINTDINLTGTGIYSLSKNSSDNTYIKTNAFTGKLVGADKTIKITNNITTYNQGNLGLFSYVEDAKINNLSIQYDITFAHKENNISSYRAYSKLGNAGAIAAFAEGEINVNNVNIYAGITEYNKDDKQGKYYGAAFGRYNAVQGKTLTIINSSIDVASVNVYTSHYFAGLIGYYNGVDITSSIVIDNINISGTINSSFTEESANIGGLIAVIDNGSSGLINLDINSISINNLDVTSKAVKTGGLLGFTWSGVNACISDILVDNESSLIVNGEFGGLINAVTGRMILDGVNINSVNVSGETISGVEAKEAKCGLLIRDGSNLYLSVKDYGINKDNVTISYYGNTFDEIVGFNRDNEKSTNGGIVSISYTGSRCIDTSNSSSYVSYTNQICTSTVNPNARYYFDLDTIINNCLGSNKIVKSDGKWQITSANQLMGWHLSNYANSSIKKYFMLCFDGYSEGTTTNNDILTGKYLFISNMDLNTYSYYPTNVSGGTYQANDITITFYADKIIANESATKKPGSANSQNYMIHAGLFNNISGVSEISGFNIAGKVTGYESGTTYYSGALIAGTVSAGTALSIKNIDINNLWVEKYGESTWNNPYGLLIANVGTEVEISFDTVLMNSYDTVNNTGKAASALIGDVGYDKAQDIDISFINMDIADVSDDASDTVSSKGSADKVLACASFIYNYSYYQDSCNGIYTFTKNDYSSGYVTLGKELGTDEGTTTVEYFDYSELVGANDTFSNLNYKPYVYNYLTKYLNVNTKTGDIIDGCGTYEDPYVITSARQLITLGWYITGKEQNAALLDGWVMNKLGSNNSFCSGSHTRVSYDSSLTETQQTANGFPTDKELASAYYIIEKNIDLSTFTTFNGLGTEELPFTGVIAGKAIGESYPKVTLPVRGSGASADGYFGLIQYAKGAAIVNLNISFAADNNISVSNAGSAVFGCIKGGDNIVDNVVVDGNIIAASENACIGAYAGQIDMGGLIIRNMSSVSLSNFAITSGGDFTVADCGNLCGIIGEVLDGYVIYEGSNNSEQALIKNISGLYNNETLDASKSYDILNATYLNTQGKIDVSYSNGYAVDIENAAQLLIYSSALNSGVLNYSSKTENSLGYDIGYNSESICRNSNYEYVGKVKNLETDLSYKAYLEAIKNDYISGTVYKPYLLDYFNIDSDTIPTIITTVSGITYCILNQEEVSSTNMENIILSSSGLYDMTEFNRAFRGIGASYYTNLNSFRGIFDGNNNTIKLGILFDKSMKAGSAALFNNINVSNVTGQSSSNKNVMVIKNFTVTGYVINGSSLSNTAHLSDGVYEESGRDASAVASSVNAVCDFENVNVLNCNVRAQGLAAGFVTKINNKNVICTFNKCTVKSNTNITNIEDIEYSIEGIEDISGFTAYINGGLVQYNNCILEKIAIKTYGNGIVIGGSAKKKYGTSKTSYSGTKLDFYGNMLNNVTKTSGHMPSAGGFIGHAQSVSNTINITACKYNIIDVFGSGNTGGMAGEILSSSTVNISGVGGELTSSSSKVMSSCKQVISGHTSGCTGAIVGYLFTTGSSSNISQITNISVNNMDISAEYPSDTENDSTYVGGIFGGACGYININNCTVGNGISGEMFIGTHNTSNSNITGNATHSLHSGGIIGGNNNGSITSENTSIKQLILTCSNCSLNGTKESMFNIDSGNTVGGVAGSLKNENVTITSFSISNVTLFSKKSTAGVIGYTATSGSLTLSDINVSNSSLSCNDLLGNGGSSVTAGVVGKLNISITLSDFCVDGIYAYSAKYASGLIGQINNNASLNIKKEKKNGEIKNSTIISIYSGGAIGENTKSSANKLYDINLISNKIIGSNSSSNDVYSGGLIAINSSNTDIYNVTLKNNYIAGDYKNLTNGKKAYVGGIVAKQNDVAFYANNINLEDNYISFISTKDIADSNLDVSNYEAVCAWIKAAEVTDLKKYAYYNNNSSYVLVSSIGKITNDNIYLYATRIGAFFGVSTASTKEKYILKTQYKSSSSEYEKYRPVSDVGYESGQNSLNNMYSYKSNIHILYGGYTNTDETVDNSIIKNKIGASEYEFASMKNIFDETMNESISISQKYRLDLAFGNIYSGTFNNGSYVSYFCNGTSDEDKVIPIVVYKAEVGEIDVVVDSYINALTNNGGELSTIGSAVTTSITTLKATVSKDDNNKAVITTESSGMSIAYENSEFVRKKYDNFTNECEGTFTIINVSYSYKVNSVTRTYTITIPVFVESMLEINSHMRYSEGFVYSVDDMISYGKYAISNDSSAVMMTNGSKYTLYSEYVYSTERTNYQNAYIDKKLYFYSGTETLSIPVGTKLTLVDVTNGNRVYYYTVTSQGVTEIEFTDFKDTSGYKYVINNICNSDNYTNVDSYTAPSGDVYENVTYERFLIYVDQSDVQEQATDKIYTAKVSMENTNVTMKKRVEYTEKSFVKIKEMAGTTEKIDISSTDENGNTYTNVAGSISENGSVKAQIRFDITAANSNYWIEKSNANTNQYFEIALSLQNQQGNTIAIPSGTKVTYKISSGTNSSNYVYDTPYLYTYLDNGLKLALDDINNDLIGTTITVSFDFGSADLSNIETGNYSVYAELIKTQNPNYPRSGIVKDVWSGVVAGESQKELGFAVETDNLMNLGMNTYLPEDSDKGEISFMADIDFNDYMASSDTSDLRLLAAKKYKMTFSIYEKQFDNDGNLIYSEYTGENINIYPAGTTEFTSENAITKHDGSEDDYTDLKSFTSEQISNGISVNEADKVEGVIENGYILKADTDNINLTNYKVVVTLDVLDTSLGEANLVSVMTLQDYYIFTVAKIKKDL